MHPADRVAINPRTGVLEWGALAEFEKTGQAFSAAVGRALREQAAMSDTFTSEPVSPVPSVAYDLVWRGVALVLIAVAAWLLAIFREPRDLSPAAA